MIFSIIVKENKDDSFSVPSNDKNKVHFISSYRDFNLNDEKHVSHSILSGLNMNSLSPSENVIDFVNLSLGVYVFDQLVPRASYGYFGWNRYFKFYLPVADVEKWNTLKPDIEKFLSFLSGDKWELNFRKRELIYENHKREENKIEKVSLLSGGLDSFVGAVDLLNNGTKNIAFVSHHKMGNSGDKSIQEELIRLLQEEYPKSEISPNYFYVQAKKDEIITGESSQRARSIIFIALGLAVANSYGSDIPILIPENGLISLNVPLTKTRYGSHSTKTTHPYFIEQINSLFRGLEINNAFTTDSCSKAGHYKQWHKKEELHCGHCTPCIIRRSSMKKAQIDSFKGNYVRDVLSDSFIPKETSSRDLIAFKIALSRLSKTKRPLIFELLKSGSIPSDSEQYVNVYKRGMKEVSDFLYKK